MSHNARIAGFTLLLIFLTIGIAFSQEKSTLSYSASIAGFSVPAISSGETIRISLTTENKKMQMLEPALFATLQFDFNPLSFQSTYLGLGFSWMLFTMRHHPFSFFSLRQTIWSPTVSAALFLPLAMTKASFFELAVEPLRFYSGSSHVSIASPALEFGKNFEVAGYSFCPFKFTYYLY